MAENENKTIDWSTVHILGLFRQYFAVTYSAWSFRHAWYNGRIDISAKKFNEEVEVYEKLVQPIFDGIMSRLGLSKEDPEHKKKFMSWYSANDNFIKNMSDEEYCEFERAESRFVENNFNLDTDFLDVLDKLKYKDYIEENTEYTGFNNGLHE